MTTANYGVNFNIKNNKVRVIMGNSLLRIGVFNGNDWDYYKSAGLVNKLLHNIAC